MKTTRQIFIFTVLATILGACSSSNNVVSERLIQKRKYNKGFFVSKRSSEHHKTVAAINTQAVKTSADYKAAAQEAQYSKVEEQTNNAIAGVDFTPEVKPNKPVTKNPVVVKKEKALAPPEITREDRKVHKAAIRSLKREKRDATNSHFDETDVILLYILCFFIPPLAVGIVTDWDVTPLIISIILSCIFWIPGVIYAIIKVSQNT